MLKRLLTLLTLALMAVGLLGPPSFADNRGDAWVTNSPSTGPGHAQVPHLGCSTIYLHGSDLDASGTYSIASFPGTGSGKTVWNGTWTTPQTGEVLATFDGAALVDAAIAQDGAVANIQQGYHFKLTLDQAGGDKYKVFWVKCASTVPVSPTPTLGVTKTADASPVVSGNDIGFSITVAPGAGSFANNVTMTDPLPWGAGLSWSISPAYSGPGDCSIGGTAPAVQTLTCSIGDLGAPDNAASASIHIISHTIAGTTAALAAVTFPNTASARADDVEPVRSTAQVVVTPAVPVTPVIVVTPVLPDLEIVKSADNASVTAGSAVGYSITVSNRGLGDARNVSLNDPLPQSGTGVWSISPDYNGPGSCAITGTAQPQTLTCSFGTLADKASATVHIVASTPVRTAETLANVATAVADNNPPVSAGAQIAVVVPPASNVAPLIQTPPAQIVAPPAQIVAPIVAPPAQIVAPQPAKVLGEVVTQTPPSATPGSEVLGLSITRQPASAAPAAPALRESIAQATGTLPVTGGVSTNLVVPAVLMLLAGGVLVALARSRTAEAGR